MLKEMLGAAIFAAGIIGAVSPAAAGPVCPCDRIAFNTHSGADPLRPHAGLLEQDALRAPVEVTRTEPDGSSSTVYVDPRSFAPVLPGMPGCATGFD